MNKVRLWDNQIGVCEVYKTFWSFSLVAYEVEYLRNGETRIVTKMKWFPNWRIFKW